MSLGKKGNDMNSKDIALSIEKKTPKASFIFNAKALPSVSIFRILWTLASWSELILLTLGVLGAVGNGITMQFLEYETGQMINELTLNTSKKAIDKGMKSVCLNYVIIGLVSLVTCFLMKGMMYYFGKRVGNKYKVAYFNMLLQQDKAWFDQLSISSHELSNLVLLQLESIQGGIGMSLGNVILNVVAILTAFIITMQLYWKFALVCCCILPVWITVQIYVFGLVKKSTFNQKALLDKVGGHLEEVLYQIKTVASYANYAYEKRNFSEQLDASLKIGKARSVKTGISMGVIFLMIFLSATIAFWYGSYLISTNDFNGDHPFNTGELFSIVVIISSIGNIVSEMVFNVRSIAESCANARMFFSLRQFTASNRKSNKKKSEEADSHPEIALGELALVNVGFTYPQQDNSVMHNLSLTIPSGKTTALIGESGCGKSTIVNLIERIYEPLEGSITIDGIPINKINIKHYRESIGYVAQEPVLFNDTIRDNITFGREKVSDDAIKAAMEKANILKFVQSLEKGLDHIVGIKGGKLSGGQKQRIAIARALLTNPKVLILDEATSALDSKSEKQVQRAINLLKGQMTMIVIAHRLNTIRSADNIVVLGKGAVVIEQGTHEELIALKGKYFEMLNQNKKEGKESTESNEFQQQLEEEDTATMAQQPLNKNNEKEAILSESKPIVEPCSDKGKEDESKHRKWKNLKRIISEFKWTFYTAFIFSLISGGLLPFSGWLTGTAVDEVVFADIQEVQTVGRNFGLFFIALGVGSFIIFFIRSYSFEYLGEQVSVSFKKQIHSTLLKLHMGYFDITSNTPGNIVSQMNIKTASIAYISLVSLVVQSIGSIISSNVIGFIYDYRLTLINFCFIPIILAINYCYTQMIAKDEQEKLNQSYGSVLSESLCNMTTILAFNAQEKVKRVFNKAVNQGKSNYKKYAAYHGVFYGLSMSIVFFAYSTYFYASGRFILDDTLTFGYFMKSMIALMNEFWVIAIMVRFLNDISLLYSSINSIYDIIDMKSEIDPSTPSKLKADINSFKACIEFRDVSFAYPTNKDKAVLNKMSFSISQGEKIGFIGSSGAGKSTIVELIERFYDASSGGVIINGVNVKDYDLPSLRKMIGFVQQEPVLFSKSVYENIKYGDLNASDEEIRAVAERCRISSKLELTINNSKNDAVYALSGGEKQRVAIARALLHKPKILLLDEATSALDNKTEMEIQAMLEEIIEEEKLTVVVIAHKLSTVAFCNKCYTIDKGVIVNEGKITDLNQNNEDKAN